MKTLLSVITGLFLFASCSNQDKSDAGTFFLKGNVQFSQRNFREAVRFYDEAIAKYPDLTDAYLNKGLALLQLERPEEAFAALSVALEKEDRFHPARLARAEAALRIGKIQAARNDLGLLANAYRDSTRYYLVKGNMEMSMHNPSAAMADYDKAIALSADNVEALVNRGALLFQERHYLPAQEDFRKALKLNPAQKEALNNLGLVAMEQGKAEEALPFFDKVLALSPKDPYALNNKGGTLLQLKRTDEALPFFQQSLEQKKDNGHALRNLGLYYYQLGDYSKAVHYYEQALALEQQVELLHGYTGLAWLALGEKEKACSAWKRGVTLSDSLAAANLQKFCR